MYKDGTLLTVLVLLLLFPNVDDDDDESVVDGVIKSGDVNLLTFIIKIL